MRRIATECPDCEDESLHQFELEASDEPDGEAGETFWLAVGWKDEHTGNDRDVAYCPFCGTELPGND